MKWITREQIRVNRTATYWLIRPVFGCESSDYLVPADKVASMQTETGAIGFDAPGATYPHQNAHGLCSFAALVQERLAHDRVFTRMARIVPAADIKGELNDRPPAHGLQLISRGFPTGYQRRYETAARAFFVYYSLDASVAQAQGLPGG